VSEFARGDVRWVEVPGAGRRPALILTRSRVIHVLNRVIVAPATRTVRGIPTEVVLDRADGMPERCAISLDNLTLVAKRAVGELICALSPGHMEEVCAALHVAVDC
jgi:mRNA interferase MazF